MGCGTLSALLYERCHAAGDLVIKGEHTVNVAGLLTAAADRFGPPEVIWCDRWRLGELREAAQIAALPFCRVVPRGQGFKDGAADLRSFKRAALDGRVTPAPSLLMVSAMAEARSVSDPAGNSKLAKGSQGGRRALARDDAVAASLLAVAAGEAMPRPSTGAFYGVA